MRHVVRQATVCRLMFEVAAMHVQGSCIVMAAMKVVWSTGPSSLWFMCVQLVQLHHVYFCADG